MRKTSKILHTLAACGLVGGLACYMVLLLTAPQDTPAAYAELRQGIAAISNYLLLPSLAVALVTGLFSMAVHTPFMNMGWAWIKAALGILMFKGVLTVIGAKADYAASVSRRIADGEPMAEMLDKALAYEWSTLIVVMALSIANVVLGIWRPRRRQPAPARARPASDGVPAPAAIADDREPARPAA